MQVEDHPVSYFDFEGIIPEGNYGAGTVMVWDVGTWEPLGDASQMLSKGDLKFRLHGKKLNGEFVLAHMRSRRPGSKGTEWLLIKKKDAAMKPDFNIDSLDHSALTDRTLAEIAGDKNADEWESNRKTKPPVMKGAEWLFESKGKKSPDARSSEARSSEIRLAKAKTAAKKKPAAPAKKSGVTKLKAVAGKKSTKSKTSSAGKSPSKTRRSA